MTTINNNTTTAFVFDPASPLVTVVAARSRSFDLRSPDDGTYEVRIDLTGSPIAIFPTATLSGANTTYTLRSTADADNWSVNATAAKELNVILSSGGDVGNITGPASGPLNIYVGPGSEVANLTLGGGPTLIEVSSGGSIGNIQVGTGPLDIIGEGSIGMISGNTAGHDLINITDADIYANTLNSVISTGGGDDILSFSGTSQMRNLFAGELINTGTGADQIRLEDGAALSTSSGVSGVSMGGGNDQLILGQNAVMTGFSVDLGAGADTVTLGQGATFTGSVNMGSDASNETITIGPGAKFYGDIFSGSSTKTTLNFDDFSSYDDGKISLGSGDDIVTGGNNVFIGGVIDLGNGNNQLIFGENTTLSGTSSYAITSGTGNGADFVQIGANSQIKGHISLFNGDNTIIIGDRSHLSETGSVITTLTGNDRLVLGDDVRIDGSIHLGAGSDTISIGSGLLAGRSGIIIDAGTGGSNMDVLELSYDPDFHALLMAQGSGWSFDGTSYSFTGYAAQQSFTYKGITFRDFERIILFCFLPGTLITTPNGECPVQDLRPGDLVTTLDHGPQLLRKVLYRKALGPELDARHQPVEIAAGALAPGIPRRPLRVSPQHRILIRSEIVQRVMGRADVLVPAISLVGRPGIRQLHLEQVEYYHLIFDKHQIVFSENAPTEAFFYGTTAESCAEAALQAEMKAFFGENARDTAPCRPHCNGKPLRKILSRHKKNEKVLLSARAFKPPVTACFP